eukprot:Awhi_evm1s11417
MISTVTTPKATIQSIHFYNRQPLVDQSVWDDISDKELKIITTATQELIKVNQRKYLSHMNSLMIPKEEKLPTHKLKCAAHEHGLVKIDKNPKRGYCFGGTDLKGKRLCDQHTPDYRKSGINSHKLYNKKFHIKSWFHTSLYTQGLRQSKESKEWITIASQGTWNRLDHLKHLAKSWQGPISFCLIVDEKADVEKLHKLVNEEENWKQWVDIHVVWRKDHTATDEDAFYPINMLRNIALQTISTTHVFVLDVDVTPNGPHFKYWEWIEESKANSEKRVAKQDCPGLVAYIPTAVEMYPDELERLNQQSKLVNAKSLKKRDLVDMLRSGDAKPMHVYYGPAYGPTNHFEWMYDNETTKIDYLTRFEPYYIAQMPLPTFNEDFVDRGGNFAEQVYEMAASGYSFYRMPNAFVVDIPHGVPAKKNKSIKRRASLINKTKQKNHNMEFITNLWFQTKDLMRRRYHVAMPDSHKEDEAFTLYRREQNKMLTVLWKLTKEFEQKRALRLEQENK